MAKKNLLHKTENVIRETCFKIQNIFLLCIINVVIALFQNELHSGFFLRFYSFYRNVSTKGFFRSQSISFQTILLF